jgi:hypothetical protein
MAVKKVLVMGTNGHPENLQAGDSISVSSTSTEVETLTNAVASAVVIGTPIFISAADAFTAARANASATAKVHGIVFDAPSIAASSPGQIATDGVVTASTGQWDVVTGQTGGLTAGADYFLDAAAVGKLTATPPSAAGQFNVYIGRAKSATDLSLSIRPSIAL